MSESKVVWHSIKKEGLPPSDCDAVLVSMQTLIGGKPEVFEAVWMVDAGLTPTKDTTISRKANLAKSTHK